MSLSSCTVTSMMQQRAMAEGNGRRQRQKATTEVLVVVAWQNDRQQPYSLREHHKEKERTVSSRSCLSHRYLLQC